MGIFFSCPRYVLRSLVHVVSSGNVLLFFIATDARLDHLLCCHVCAVPLTVPAIKL
jgi:hypothetical protein